jgi:tetratricopeptide (TPR) repeat protein
MKKTIVIIILGLIQASLFSQSKLDIIFENANKSYADEKYEESVKFYSQILDNGFESAELYYNIGNAFFKLRNYPKAILNYEKALLIDPDNENFQHNLAKAKMYNVDKVDEIPEFIISSWINKLIGLFSSNRWAIISLTSFAFAIICFLIYFFSATIKLKRISFYSAILIMLISVATYYFTYHAKTDIRNSRGAIVMEPTVTVKGSPRETGIELFIIHEGTKVFIINKLDNWYEIKLLDGKQGWLLSSAVEKI